MGLSTSTYSIDFTQNSDNSSWAKNWTVTAGSVNYNSSGANFIINKSGDAPTIETAFYFFYGAIEVHMRSAPGTGIVSSIVLESDDLDEIDWEFLGGNANSVETNYFGKGNTTSYDRAKYYAVSDSQSTSHNYTVEWTKEYTSWYIDGTSVRTLNYADAASGTNYPQTPMRLKLGIWAGGDAAGGDSEGTIEWAGGDTDFTKAPFDMTVQSVKITNYNPAASYSYGDQTGDSGSIKLSNETVATTTSSAIASAKASGLVVSDSAEKTASTTGTGSTAKATSAGSAVSNATSNTALSATATAVKATSFALSLSLGNVVESAVLGAMLTSVLLLHSAI